jgi:hypothetical protein
MRSDQEEVAAPHAQQRCAAIPPLTFFTFRDSNYYANVVQAQKKGSLCVKDYWNQCEPQSTPDCVIPAPSAIAPSAPGRGGASGIRHARYG